MTTGLDGEGRLQALIRVGPNTCRDCGYPLVWTERWQGWDCVICLRVDAYASEHDAALSVPAAPPPQDTKMRAVLEKVLRSMAPNPKEHPTMFVAWAEAHSFLAMRDLGSTE